MDIQERAQELGTELRNRLIDAGLIVPTSQAGVVGFSGAFEEVVARIATALDNAAARACDTAPDPFLFPPIIPDAEFRRSKYITSFPQLAGLISALHGVDDSKDQSTQVPANPEEAFRYSQLAMLSAACHPIYAMLADSEVTAVRTFTVTGRCFRHEPSSDPMRLQAFRMREYVAVGSDAEVTDFADRWATEMPGIFDELGVPVTSEIANDPFFGRTRHMLAAQQRGLQQKVEMLAQVHPGEEPTAIASINRPGSHFGDHFGITSANEPANTVCVAFGIERIAIAMLAQHGFDTDGIHFA